MVTRGELAKPRRGAYVAAGVWSDLDAAGRHAVRARAVLLQAGAPVALSHTSGVVEYDGPLQDIPLDDVHLTRLDARAGRKEAGVCQHRGTVLPGDVVERNGVPVMSPARLALEVTTLVRPEVALGVVNHFLHTRLTTREEVVTRYAGMSAWPRTLATDLVLRLSDLRVESVGESRCVWLFFQQGLPAPIPQYVVRDAWGREVARVDFAWPELGIFLEFDGRVKYEKLLKPGQRASDVVIAEKKREELVCRITGWRCIRLTWADLQHPERTAEMLRTYLRPVVA